MTISLYIFGGAPVPNEVGVTFNDLWVVRMHRNGTVTHPWEQLCLDPECAIAPRTRSGGAMVAHRGKLYLFGGLSVSSGSTVSFGDVFEFDLDTNVWQLVCAAGT